MFLALFCLSNEKQLTVDNLNEAYKKELSAAQFTDESRILNYDDLLLLVNLIFFFFN